MKATATATATMTRRDIERVIQEIPLLTDFGVGVYQGDKLSREAYDAAFQKNRQDLLDSEEACSRVCEWLSGIAKTKTLNPRRSSYGLKHLAAHEIGYVTNGVFIAAAVHCGFPYRRIGYGPNVEFGISEKSLKAKSGRRS